MKLHHAVVSWPYVLFYDMNHFIFTEYTDIYELTSTYSDKHSKVFSRKLFLDCLVSIVRIWPPKFLLSLWEWRFLRVEDLESLWTLRCSLESDSSTSPNSIICNIINQLRLKLISIASRLNENIKQLFKGEIDKQLAEKFVVKIDNYFTAYCIQCDKKVPERLNIFLTIIHKTV